MRKRISINESCTPGKRLLLQFSVILLAISLLSIVAQAKQKDDKDKKDSVKLKPVSIAVVDFGDTGMRAPGVGRAVSEMLIGKLSPDPVFSIYERGRLDEIMEEQKRGNPSDMDGNTIRAGRIAGVQFVIAGKVTEFGVSDNSVLIPGQGTVTRYKARVGLDVRVIQVSNAQVLKTWNTYGTETSFNLGVNILGIPNFSFHGSEFDDSPLGKATRKAVDSAAEEIPAYFSSDEVQKMVAALKMSAIVADVEGGKIIINAGRIAGVKVGQYMDVFRVTKQVKNPDNGEILTEKRRPVAKIQVTRVEDKYSEASVVENLAGEQIATGDIVEEGKPAEPAGDNQVDTEDIVPSVLDKY